MELLILPFSSNFSHYPIDPLCARYYVMVSQLETHPSILYFVILRLGLCELHFCFDGWLLEVQ